MTQPQMLDWAKEHQIIPKICIRPFGAKQQVKLYRRLIASVFYWGRDALVA